MHNLIAGSFTFVGAGTDNGAPTLENPRYTPYHMRHSTAVAGFMTILHGDARFYENIFAEQGRVPQSVRDYCRAQGIEKDTDKPAGTSPYEGWPTPEEYFAMFSAGVPRDRDCYYKPLPVYTGGNVYFGGAKPCSAERDYAVVEGPVKLEYSGGELVTDIFDRMPELRVAPVSTDTLGEAFEPEQRFEAPDGSPIAFDTDFFGARREGEALPGPFAAPSGRIKLIK